MKDLYSQLFEHEFEVLEEEIDCKISNTLMDHYLGAA
jgi:hypothetical protein